MLKNKMQHSVMCCAKSSGSKERKTLGVWLLLNSVGPSTEPHRHSMEVGHHLMKYRWSEAVQKVVLFAHHVGHVHVCRRKTNRDIASSRERRPETGTLIFPEFKRSVTRVVGAGLADTMKTITKYQYIEKINTNYVQVKRAPRWRTHTLNNHFSLPT